MLHGNYVLGILQCRLRFSKPVNSDPLTLLRGTAALPLRNGFSDVVFVLATRIFGRALPALLDGGVKNQT